MADSNSFTSLLALVDSHLSKTSIHDSDSPGRSIQIPTLGQFPSTSQSETLLSHSVVPKLPIPTLNMSESPITNILAEQVANMIKAKEKKQKEQEDKKLEEELKKMNLKEDDDSYDYFIDLSKAVKTPYGPGTPVKMRMETLSASSSMESLFEPKFIDCEEYPLKPKSATPEPQLPCTSTMAYILDQRVYAGKCSNFGKVVSSRYRPVAAPYLKEDYKNKVKKFDFETKSPCDVIIDKLRKPSRYNAYHFDIC